MSHARPAPADAALYGPLARLYDVVFQRFSRPRWRLALSRVHLPPGSRILEVGVGTGLSLPFYPRDCHITGVDISSPMLDLARRRIRRLGLTNVTLDLWDGQRLTERFAPGSFDCVTAAFVLSVVPDPLAVLRGMRTVGTEHALHVIINHMKSQGTFMGRLEQLVCPLTTRLGWKSDFVLDPLLDAARLRPTRVHKMHPMDLWSIVYAAPVAAEAVPGSVSDPFVVPMRLPPATVALVANGTHRNGRH